FVGGIRRLLFVNETPLGNHHRITRRDAPKFVVPPGSGMTRKDVGGIRDVLTGNRFPQDPIKLTTVIQPADDDELPGSLCPDHPYQPIGATTPVRRGYVLRFIKDLENH